MSNIGETSSNRNRREHRIQSSDPGSPLTNLSVVHTRMDSLQQFLSGSISSNTLISKNQMDMVSSEISSAIHQIIINGAALLAASNPLPAPPPPPQAPSASDPKHPDKVSEKTIRISDDGDEKSEYEVVELDAVELLAEHIHFCDICGKGFKRDANLRMHMRAHGNEYKTAEALAKPDKSESESGRERRFSCPFEGCNRNKKHGKFRALKSVTCVKNHFKRSHCPKTYRCERCNKKSFSVVSDLKSHYKQCGGGGSGGGGSRWRCSCGTTFSRKDKLFGHVALFEGHMPLVDETMKDEDDHGRDGDGDDNDDDNDTVVVEVEEEIRKDIQEVGNGMDLDDGFFQGLLDDFGSIENYCLQDVFGSPNKNESPRWNGEFL